MSFLSVLFLAFLFAVAACGLMLIFLPRGYLLHELIHLPLFWIKAFSRPVDQIITSRHSYGAHSRQYVLFCRPVKGIDPQKPLLIYFHGGGWMSGSPEMFLINAQALTEKGYGVFMPSCRRTPGYNYSEISKDLSLSLALIKSLAASHNLEDQKVIIGGMSSGGNLSALALLNQKILNNGGWKSEDFAGLFLLCAPLDLNLMADTPLLRLFAGSRKRPLFQEANPINYLEEEEPTAILIIQGDKDGLVNYKNARSFASRLKELNPQVMDYHELQDTTHLDTAAWAFRENETRKLLMKWLEEVSEPLKVR